MRVRYTDPAAIDLDESISYLRDNAPAVVADFADSIDNAVAQLLDQPYSAQETEQPGVRRKYIRRFRYAIFYTVAEDELVILHIRALARCCRSESDVAAALKKYESERLPAANKVVLMNRTAPPDPDSEARA
jgi:plasmid stabilization system protein ParE